MQQGQRPGCQGVWQPAPILGSAAGSFGLLAALAGGSSAPHAHCGTLGPTRSHARAPWLPPPLPLNGPKCVPKGPGAAEPKAQDPEWLLGWGSGGSLWCQDFVLPLTELQEMFLSPPPWPGHLLLDGCAALCPTCHSSPWHGISKLAEAAICGATRLLTEVVKHGWVCTAHRVLHVCPFSNRTSLPCPPSLGAAIPAVFEPPRWPLPLPLLQQLPHGDITGTVAQPY